MKIFLDKDLLAGLFLIGVGSVYYYMANSLHRSLLSDRVGADGFPKLLAVTLIIFSTIMILQSVIKRKPSSATTADEGDDRLRFKFKNAAGMLLLGIGYLLIVSWAGYMVSIALLILVALRYQGEPLSWNMLLFTVLAGIFFWVFFVFALKIPMPGGIWPGLFGIR